METKRQKQIAELIKRHFSITLQQEGSYIYESALVTITNVKMSPDLGLAKIYCSVYNTENKQAVILQMEEAYLQLKKNLYQRIRSHVRRVPNLRFYLDDTLDEMYRLNALFDRLHDEKQMGEEE